MLLIYVPKITNRLGYTLNVVFRYVLRADFAITTDRGVFEKHEGARLSYGDRRIGDEVFVKAKRLLFETTITDQELQPIDYDGSRAFFPVYGRDLDFPFDVFSAIFYLISRYEEYLPYVSDEHGRFRAKDSLAYREGFLQRAVVDRWSLLLRDKIKEKYPDFKYGVRQYEFVETVDIDAAYCYKHKGVGRTAIGLLRDAFGRHDMGAVKSRLAVLGGKEPDPYDTFDYIIEQKERRKGTKLIFFVLLGDYGVYDKPASYLNPEFGELLKHLNDHSKLGIHPSYGSLEKPQLIDIESKRLSDILHRRIVRSRYHFLRLQFPQSYRSLVHAGIVHDYSLGFAEEPGFRAGIATPYPYYDLSRDEEVALLLHPFEVMDTTLQRYQNMTKEEAKEALAAVIGEVRTVGGTFSCIWHNQNLCEDFGWEGWREVYEYMMDTAAPRNTKGERDEL